MVSRYGTHFERSAILGWLGEGNNYCPVTGNPLRPSGLISDKTLQWKISYWAKKHGFDDDFEPQEDEAETSIGFVAVPQEKFLCSLTREMMDDPVMTRDGLNFERRAILEWLDKNGEICPVTKKPLRRSGLVTNSKLEWEIRQWKLSYGDASEEMSRLELESKLSKAEMVSRDFGIADILRALHDDSNENAYVEEEEAKQGAEDGADVSTTRAHDILSVLDDVMDTL